jgi:hypothetical protein
MYNQLKSEGILFVDKNVRLNVSQDTLKNAASDVIEIVNNRLKFRMVVDESRNSEPTRRNGTQGQQEIG